MNRKDYAHDAPTRNRTTNEPTAPRSREGENDGVRVLDLFSGTRSATRPFAEAGHEVEYVEIAEGNDIRAYHPPHRFDFVWASPPCQEYSYFNRKFGTWESKYDADGSLWLGALRVIHEARPRYWIIENVKGAQQRWGRAPYHYGGFFLWGWFPFQLLPTIPWTTSLKGTHADRKVKTEKNGGLYQWDEGRSPTEKAIPPKELTEAIFRIVMSEFGFSARQPPASTPELPRVAPTPEKEVRAT